MNQKNSMATLLSKKPHNYVSLLSYGRQSFCLAPCKAGLSWKTTLDFRYHTKKDANNLEQIERTTEKQGFKNKTQKKRFKSESDLLREGCKEM